MDDEGVAIEVQRLAFRAWMFDAEFHAKAKTAMHVVEHLGDEVTPDIKRAMILAAYVAQHDWSKPLTQFG